MTLLQSMTLLQTLLQDTTTCSKQNKPLTFANIFQVLSGRDLLSELSVPLAFFFDERF